MNKKEIQTLVESCWEVACTAKMPCAGEMVVTSHAGISGGTLYDGARFQTYLLLLSSLTPKGIQKMEGVMEQHHKVDKEKEPWQE